MSPVANSFDLLIKVAREKKLPFVDLLRPGQNRNKILEETNFLGLSLPKEVIDIYEYSDGIDVTGRWVRDIDIYYGYTLSPLKVSVKDYLNFKQHQDDMINQSWFPLLKLDSDYFFVDCDLAKETEPYIWHYMLENEPYIAFSTVKSMFDTFIDCYQEGAFTVVNGEVTEYDDRLETQIALKHNPQVKYWRDRLLQS